MGLEKYCRQQTGQWVGGDPCSEEITLAVSAIPSPSFLVRFHVSGPDSSATYAASQPDCNCNCFGSRGLFELFRRVSSPQHKILSTKMQTFAFNRLPSVVHTKTTITTITTRRPSFRVAAVRSTGVTVEDVKNSDGGRMVVEVEGQKVLLAAVGEEVFAVSNKCSHMGISLVGASQNLSALSIVVPAVIRLCTLCKPRLRVAMRSSIRQGRRSFCKARCLTVASGVPRMARRFR